MQDVFQEVVLHSVFTLRIEATASLIQRFKVVACTAHGDAAPEVLELIPELRQLHRASAGSAGHRPWCTTANSTPRFSTYL
jgi:hypothetical protein